MVREKPPQIVAPHGISPIERDHLTEGLDYLRRQGPCVFVSIEAGKSPEAEEIVRTVTGRTRSRIALMQGRAKMRQKHAVTVFEALGRDLQPKFNSHIVALAPDAPHRDKIIEALNTSNTYGRHILAEEVDDWEKLPGYLLKEATQQATFRKDIRRIGGSIPLGVGGGNRVILAPHLRDALIRSGRIEPFTRSYACRAPLPFATAPQIAAPPPPPMTVEAWFASLPMLAAPPAPPPVRRKRRPVREIENRGSQTELFQRPDIRAMIDTIGPNNAERARLLGVAESHIRTLKVGFFRPSREVWHKLEALAA